MPFSNKSLEVLITYVVAYRLFGWSKNEAQEAMKELMQRKSTNPKLNFEELIEQAIMQAPQSKIDLKKPFSISSLLHESTKI